LDFSLGVFFNFCVWKDFSAVSLMQKNQLQGARLKPKINYLICLRAQGLSVRRISMADVSAISLSKRRPIFCGKVLCRSLPRETIAFIAVVHTPVYLKNQNGRRRKKLCNLL
jgi:hypothetical protein